MKCVGGGGESNLALDKHPMGGGGGDTPSPALHAMETWTSFGWMGHSARVRT